MKVEVSIDPTCKEPKVIILTDKMTEEIGHIMETIASAGLIVISLLYIGIVYYLEQYLRISRLEASLRYL